jgi:hypothetical protein
MRRDAFLISLSTLLATSIGCGVVDEGEPAELPDEASALTTTAEVARVTTSDGSSWRFIESEPGVLWLWSIRPETSTVDWSHLDLDRRSYVEVYQRLTTAPVPRALRDAQARADAQANERDPSTTDGGLVDDASGPPKTGATSAISAASFQNNYCYAGWDYLYCWPSFYGSPYVQRKAFSVDGYVAAVNNTVQFRLRYKKYAASGWTTSVSAQALPGQVHHVHGHHWGYQRWRRWEVLDNGNNLVRYSAFGLDD